MLIPSFAAFSISAININLYNAILVICRHLCESLDDYFGYILQNASIIYAKLQYLSIVSVIKVVWVLI